MSSPSAPPQQNHTFQITCLTASNPSSNNLLRWNNTSPSGLKCKFFFWIKFSELSSLSVVTGVSESTGICRRYNPFPQPLLWLLTRVAQLIQLESSALVTLNHRSNHVRCGGLEWLKFLTLCVFRLDCHWLGGGEDPGVYSMSWLLSTCCSQVYFQDWVFFKGVTFFLHENGRAELLLNVNKEWWIGLFAFKCLYYLLLQITRLNKWMLQQREISRAQLFLRFSIGSCTLKSRWRKKNKHCTARDIW